MDKNNENKKLTGIPSSVAKNLAKEYGYDQIFILGFTNSKDDKKFPHSLTAFNKDIGKLEFSVKIARVLIHNFIYFYRRDGKILDKYIKESDREI